MYGTTIPVGASPSTKKKVENRGVVEYVCLVCMATSGNFMTVRIKKHFMAVSFIERCCSRPIDRTTDGTAFHGRHSVDRPVGG